MFIPFHQISNLWKMISILHSPSWIFLQVTLLPHLWVSKFASNLATKPKSFHDRLYFPFKPSPSQAERIKFKPPKYCLDLPTKRFPCWIWNLSWPRIEWVTVFKEHDLSADLSTDLSAALSAVGKLSCQLITDLSSGRLKADLIVWKKSDLLKSRY